jgi:hypothetical protein
VAAIGSESEANALYLQMCQARRQWESASENFEDAVERYRGMDEDSDGMEALRGWCAREIESLKRYRDAVQAYARAVKTDAAQ